MDPERYCQRKRAAVANKHAQRSTGEPEKIDRVSWGPVSECQASPNVGVQSPSSSTFNLYTELVRYSVADKHKGIPDVSRPARFQYSAELPGRI